MAGRYGMEDHKAAFEVFAETRHYASAARFLGSNTDTVFRWSEKGYVCPFGCPWHGWEDLLEERARAMKDVTNLVAKKGSITPLEQAKTVEDALETTFRDDKANLINAIVRSDLERLTHLELLYTRVFYNLTGVALPIPGVVYPRGMEEFEKRDILQMGLHVTNFEAGLRCLTALSNQIATLRGTYDIPNKIDETDVKVTKLSIGELRQLKGLLESDDKSKVAETVEKAPFLTAFAPGEEEQDAS